MLNLQEHKIRLIEELLAIEDPNLVPALESFVETAKKKYYLQQLEPMSLSVFYELIEKAETDINIGNYSTSEQLLEEIEKW